MVELLKGSHNRDLVADPYLGLNPNGVETTKVALVQLIRASPAALSLRGFDFPVDKDGHLIVGMRMRGQSGEGDAYVSIPDVFSLGPRSF